MLKEALKLLRATLPATIHISQSIDGDLPDVLADPTQIHQIVMNLCTNAAHAMRGTQGELRVRLEPVQLTDVSRPPTAELHAGDYVRLTIGDTGHGMDEATVRRIFDPFFTTNGPGEGTGLGFSVVHGIVKDHEGAITVESKSGVGTAFQIYLPVGHGIGDQPDRARVDLPRGRGEHILFVDDEVALGAAAGKLIRRLGYQPFVFSSPEAAWQAIQQDPQAFDLLISDLTMPVMTGLDLARKVLSLRPGLPVILTSGSSGTLTPADVRKLGIRELVGKPMNHEALALIIHQVLHEPRPLA